MSKEIEQNMKYWCDDIYENVIEHIIEAKKVALNHGIEANTIIMKKDFAITQGFYDPTINGVVPAMVCGLKVFYEEDELPHNANFVITHAELLERPVYTHELAFDEVWNEIKEKSKSDFLNLCKETTDDLNAKTEFEKLKAVNNEQEAAEIIADFISSAFIATGRTIAKEKSFVTDGIIAALKNQVNDNDA